MQELLQDLPGARLRLLLVWEPVLVTDIAPPTIHALGRLGDPRAAQFWDPTRSLSRLMVSDDEEILWDYVAVYPAGARWTTAPPAPAFEGGPVKDQIDEMRRWLAATAVAPARRPRSPA